MPTSGRGKRPGVLGVADDASERRRLALGHSPRSAETSTEELKSDTIHELREFSETDVGIVAEHVNPPTAPPHMRLLCRLRAPWPDGYEPLSAPEFQPIAT